MNTSQDLRARRNCFPSSGEKVRREICSKREKIPLAGDGGDKGQVSRNKGEMRTKETVTGAGTDTTEASDRQGGNIGRPLMVRYVPR